jgi:molecular chaperone GrpE (heat shock protein)
MSTLGMKNMDKSKKSDSALAANPTGTRHRTLAEAEAEIAQLKLELARAQEELDNLSEATSDFVRLVI